MGSAGPCCSALRSQAAPYSLWEPRKRGLLESARFIIRRARSCTSRRRRKRSRAPRNCPAPPRRNTKIGSRKRRPRSTPRFEPRKWRPRSWRRSVCGRRLSSNNWMTHPRNWRASPPKAPRVTRTHCNFARRWRNSATPCSVRRRLPRSPVVSSRPPKSPKKDCGKGSAPACVRWPNCAPGCRSWKRSRKPRRREPPRTPRRPVRHSLLIEPTP